MNSEAIRLILIFFLGLGLSLYLTPLMAEAARRFGLVAKPDGNLRRQKEPVPYMGGVAIYLAFLLALVFGFGFGFEKQVIGLLLGGTIILMVGLIDDFGVMTPWMKLFGELLAVMALLKSGIHLEIQLILDVEPIPEFPLLSYSLSALWLLTIMNAFNFLDIEDGLCGGAAFFSGIGLLIVSIINRNPAITSLTCALLAGVLGFLLYNFHPAKIYLGDAGSLFLGMMFGALAMIGSYTDQSPLGLFAPALILGVPLWEISFTSFARLIQGKPIMQGSPDHLVKRLKKMGLSLKPAVIAHYLLAIALAGAGLLVMLLAFRPALILLIISFSVLLIFTIVLLRVKMEIK